MFLSDERVTSLILLQYTEQQQINSGLPYTVPCFWMVKHQLGLKTCGGHVALNFGGIILLFVIPSYHSDNILTVM